MRRAAISKADPVKARTRAMHSTLKRRAEGAEVMSLDELRAEFDLFMRRGGRCQYCLARVSHVTVSLDHRIPVNRGGPHSRINLAFVCKGCNKAKGNMTDAEYMDLLATLDTWAARHRKPSLSSDVVTALRVASSFRIGANRRAKR